MVAVATLATPANVAADGFGVAPAVVYVTAEPGQSVEQKLTINNKEDVPYTFALSVETTPSDMRREGYEELVDNVWVNFDRQSIEIGPHSSGEVRVRITIPPGDEWLEQKWETWLKVTATQEGLFNIVLYVRLLIATGQAAPKPPPAPEPSGLAGSINWALAGGIIGWLAIIAVVWWMMRQRA